MPTFERRKLICLGALAVLVVAGALIRARTLVAWPLWVDEAATWKTTHASWIDMLRWRHHPDHPPLSYLLVKAAVALFGHESEWVLRLPSFLAGVACIPAIFVLGRCIRGDLVGLLAAALVAADPNLVNQSRQARMYTLFALLLILTATAMIALLRAERPPSRWRLTGLGVLVALLYWANNLGLVAWVALIACVVSSLALLPRPVRARAALRWSIPFLVAAVLCADGLIKIVSRASHDSGSRGVPLQLDRAGEACFASLASMYGSAWLALLVAPLALLGIVLVWRWFRPVAVLLFTLVATTGVGVLLLVMREGGGSADRYLTSLQPALWIGTAAYAGVSRWRWAGTIGVLAVVTVLGLHSARSRPTLRHFEGLEARWLRDHLQPEDALVYHPPATLIAEYYGVLPRPRGGPLDRRLPTELKPSVLSRWKYPAAWLVFSGMWGGREKAHSLVQLFAKHYGVAPDPGPLDRQLDRYHSAVVRIDRELCRVYEIIDQRDLVPVEH